MVEARGNLVETVTDLSVTINGIHAQMHQMDPVAAEAFKRAVQMGVAREDGPVWGGEKLRFTGIGFTMPGPRKEPGQ